MTRPRFTYRYGAQAVRSAGGAFRLVVDDEPQRSLTLLERGELRWREAAGRFSPQQLFVSDDGCSVVLDARDVLSFRDPRGRPIGELSLIEWLSSDPVIGASSRIMRTTAGSFVDEYWAGSFVTVGSSTRFVIDGRGLPPLAIDPSMPSVVELDGPGIREAQRERAASVLAEAAQALALPDSGGLGAWTPWRLAAVGWARLAGRTLAHDAVPSLHALAGLEMVIHGMTTVSVTRCAEDAILVDQYARDPLRQAVHLALLRMGHRPPAAPVVQLARRRGSGMDWVTFERPAGWGDAPTRIRAGLQPSQVVELLGAPTHVGCSDGRAVWSYDHWTAHGIRSLVVTWGRAGAEAVELVEGIPEPAQHGRVA